MKKYTLTLVSLALSACLTACSGGGGGSNGSSGESNSTPQQASPVPQQNSAAKSPIAQAPSAPQATPQAALPQQEAKPSAPQAAKPSAPQVTQPQAAPAPAAPEAPSNPQPKVVYEGKKVNRYTANGEWNIAYSELKVPNIEPNANKIYEEDDLVIVNGEKSITIRDNDVGAHEITLLGEGAYYGYFRDTQDKKSLFKQFVYAIDKAFESKAVPQELTAHYAQKNGFAFSANGLVNSGGAKSEPNLQKQGDVELTFENGKATGTIIIRDGNRIDNPVFNISGDTKELKIQPTKEVERLNFNIHENDNGLMPIHFVDSQKEANDLNYVVGATKADNWSGVLGATKTE